MEDRSKVIEELVRGRDFANQLRQLINGDCDDVSAQHLVQNVLSSFANTLFLLNQSQHFSQLQLNDSSLLNLPAKSEESCKSYTVKERRGCYKRRRTSQTWEKESETPIDDGHQWRKYGQKVILNAKYARNYYRCTHKPDQGCQATKQLQRIQEDPPLYRTIYYGHHTCRNLLNPEIIRDSTSSPPDSSILLSFDNTTPNQACPFFSSSVKTECKEEVPSSSLEDYLLSPLHVTLSSTLESHHSHRDVISGVLCDSVELDDFFEPFVGF